MSKACFLILFLLFSPVLCFCEGPLQKQDNAASKEETLNPNVWDFGRVKKGEVLKHVFILKNESQKTMRIKEVTTSCGCTVSRLKKRTLLAQESTSLEVKFNTKGYSGPTKQYLYVRTDSLDNSIIRFIIKADIAK